MNTATPIAKIRIEHTIGVVGVAFVAFTVPAQATLTPVASTVLPESHIAFSSTADGIDRITINVSGSHEKPAQSVDVMSIAHGWLSLVRELAEGWDGEGALPPSSDALNMAAKVIATALTIGIEPIEVDADVLGGVAIWFSSAATDHKKTVWVSCLNSGGSSAIFQDRTHGHRVQSHELSDDILDRVAPFINGVASCD